jgi:hypothetical protein
MNKAILASFIKKTRPEIENEIFNQSSHSTSLFEGLDEQDQSINV